MLACAVSRPERDILPSIAKGNNSEEVEELRHVLFQMKKANVTPFIEYIRAAIHQG